MQTVIELFGLKLYDITLKLVMLISGDLNTALQS